MGGATGCEAGVGSCDTGAVPDDLADSAYLWDGSDPGWVLWRLGGADGRPPSFSIFNRITKLALVIEDDEEAQRVMDAMASNGVDVIDEYPRD